MPSLGKTLDELILSVDRVLSDWPEIDDGERQERLVDAVWRARAAARDRRERRLHDARVDVLVAKHDLLRTAFGRAADATIRV